MVYSESDQMILLKMVSHYQDFCPIAFDNFEWNDYDYKEIN